MGMRGRFPQRPCGAQAQREASLRILGRELQEEQEAAGNLQGQGLPKREGQKQSGEGVRPHW